MFDPNEHMLKLKGKDYLQVMWRLVWFREEHPTWSIDTDMVSYDAEHRHAIFKATIADENGVPKSTGYGSESVKDFGDFIEKAETKAVGRALAMLGYGTQFAPELDEEERIVDSPVQRNAPAPTLESKNAPPIYACEKCGTVIMPYKGKNGQEIAVEKHVVLSKKKFGGVYCTPCIKSGELVALNENAD